MDSINLCAQNSQVEIIPQFDRDVYFGWLITSAYGNEKQRKRYSAAVDFYDRYKVVTRVELQAAIEAEQKSSFANLQKSIEEPIDATEQTPKEVKFYHAIMFAAMEKHVAGAYRLFVLAKSIDTEGSGNIEINRLREVAQEVGIRTPVFDRWFSGMLKADFAVKDKTGTRLILRSPARVAIAIGCVDVGKRPGVLKVKDIFGQGWRANVWASFLALYRNPISRDKLIELTGVPKSTQIRYEHEAGVKVKRNCAESDIPGENIDAAIDVYEKEHAFISKSNKVCWQLPNSYVVPSELSCIGRKGRTKKINQKLRAYQTRHLGGVVNVTDVPLRIYFASLKSADAAIRKRNDFTPGTAYAKQEGISPPWKDMWHVVNTGVELQP